MAKKKSFDLMKEAEALYLAAKARGDASDAVSALRFMRDLAVKSPEAVTRRDHGVPVDRMTADELVDLDRILAEMDALTARVNARLGPALTDDFSAASRKRQPPDDAPEPAPPAEPKPPSEEELAQRDGWEEVT
jgi:hypothetical protein